MATINVNSAIEEKAQEVLADKGMDLSTAINIFLQYIVDYREMPSELEEEVPNQETLKAIENVRNGIGLSRSFTSVEELMEDLNADDPV